MWFNPIMKSLLQSPFHGFVSKNMMLIKFNGRKSGREYVVPVNYVRTGKTLWVISLPERTWWRNLRGGVPVEMRLQGQDARGTAVVIEDQTAVAVSLAEMLQQAPQYARYLEISMNGNGQPDQAALLGAAADRVMVQIKEQSS